jgi:serine/threonine protein kinase
LAKQRLPRIKDVTPEISPSDMTCREKDVLGSGGYGYVLKGAFKGEPVAIKAVFGNDMKSVPASVTKMMRREAMIMCSLNHPNILKIHGVVSERGWIVMELCEGGALDEVLNDPEFILDHSTRLRIAAETATGIAYLHLSDVSIVHGDMKAGNVLLTKDLSVRICDFGMSEAKNRSKTMTVAASSSGKGGTALTVAWSAPELFKDRPKSFATDIYALGMTLWEIYERRVPFGNMPEAAVVNQVLSGHRPEIGSTEIPQEIRKLIQLCWSEDPRERPAADKMAFILTRLWNMDTERQKAAAEAAAAIEKKKAEEAEAKARATKKADEAKAEKISLKSKAETDDDDEKQETASKIFCSACGAKLTGSKFCAQCGEKC